VIESTITWKSEEKWNYFSVDVLIYVSACVRMRKKEEEKERGGRMKQ